MLDQRDSGRQKCGLLHFPGEVQGLASIGSQCERNLDDSDISGLSPRKSVGSID